MERRGRVIQLVQMVNRASGRSRRAKRSRTVFPRRWWWGRTSGSRRMEKPAAAPLAMTRQRCWRYAWVIDLDIRGFFDNLDHALLMRAVGKYTQCRCIVLYVTRWLEAPAQLEDGTLAPRTKGTPQGGVV